MIYVLSHMDSDGRFASYCAWRYYKGFITAEAANLSFHEVQYGRPFPLDVDTLTKDDTVYILDFSYSKEILDPVAAKVKKLQVLDHHESSKDQLIDRDYAYFDLSKSGALLAWEYFFPQEMPPLACLLTNDRDLWAKVYGDVTNHFEAWLHFDRVKQDFVKWDALVNNQAAMRNALEKGKLIYEHDLSIIAAFTGNPYNFKLCEGHLYKRTDNHIKLTKFVLYNGNQVLISELAESFYNANKDHATIDYRVRNDVVTFSVRSPDLKILNAKEYCISQGGGGHPKAAGFSLPRKEAFEYIESLYAMAVAE